MRFFQKNTPCNKQLSKRRQKRNQAGNVFAMLFGAVAMVGVIGASTMTVMRGPVKSMSEVTKRTIAENNMMVTAKLAVISVANLPTADCDTDGTAEAPGYSGATIASTNGGQIPSSVGVSKQDPWGQDFVYCAWDHGSDNDQTCGAATGYLQGDSSASPSEYAVAVISAGPDGNYQTTCNNYTGPNSLISRTGGSDDIVFGYTFQEAAVVAGGIWSEDMTGRAEADRDLVVTDGTDEQFNFSLGTQTLTIGNDSSTGSGKFANVNTGLITGYSGTPGVDSVDIALGAGFISADGDSEGISIDASGNVTGSGSITANALTSSTTLGITGAATVGSLDAGSGTIQTTGSVLLGGTTVDSLNSAGVISATGGNIILNSNFLSGDGGNEGISIDASGNVTASNNLDVTGTFTPNTLDVTNNATIGGTLGVTGSTTLAGLSAGATSLSGNLDLNNNKLIDLGTPTLDADAATKKYVDDNIAAGTGFTETDPQVGDVSGTGTYCISDGDSIECTVVTPPGDDLGDHTATTDLNMSSEQINNLAPPTLGGDAANKTYVDNAVSAAAGSDDKIMDADGDTQVQVEEGADDDTIRFDTAGLERIRIEADGNVVINTDYVVDDQSEADIDVNVTYAPATAALLTANRNFTGISLAGSGYANEDVPNSRYFTQRGILGDLSWDEGDTGISGGSTIGIQGISRHKGSGATRALRGVMGIASLDNTGTVTTASGLLAQTRTLANGTITTANGVSAVVKTEATGTITNAYGVNSSISEDLGGTITSAEAYRADCNDADTCYGLHIFAGDAEVLAGQDWGVYVTGEDQNYFSGNVGIGDPTPDGTLKVDIEGQIGATAFCDEDGNNCITAATLASGISTSIEDADGDTKIQVEEAADDDTIRFDTAGAERVTISPTGTVAISQANTHLRLNDTDDVGGEFSYVERNNTGLNIGEHDGTTSAVRMTIDDGGNVGIGTTSPLDKLHVDNGDVTSIAVEHNDVALGFSGYVVRDNTAQKWAIGATSDSYFDATTQNAFTILQTTDKTDTLLNLPRFTINNEGNVGIGTTNPNTDAKLHLYSATGEVNLRVETGDSSVAATRHINSDAHWRSGIQGGDDFVIREVLPSTGSRFTIQSGGNVGINTTSPDISAKLEIKSNSKGFLPPRVSDPTADIATPATGLVAYDITDDELQVFDGTAWVAMNGSASGDNLGDHTATQDLIMGTNKIIMANDATAGPDIDLEGRGVIAADDDLILAIDSNNTGAGAVFRVTKNSETNGGTDILSINENGTITAQGPIENVTDPTNAQDAATKAYVDGITVAQLIDVDGDTQIQVEEGADDDTIRFDTAGTERLVINPDGSIVADNAVDGHQIGKLTINYGSSGNPQIGSAGDTVTITDNLFFNSAGSNFGATSQKADSLKIVHNRQGEDIEFATSPVTSDITVTQMIIEGSTGNVGIGTASPSASSLLELSATDKGFLPPRVSDPNANITSPATGLVAYDTNDDELQVFDGTSWVSMNGAGSALAIDDLTDGANDGSSTFLGAGAGANDDGTANKNISLGFNTLAAVTSGADNTAVGHNALALVTSNANTAIGQGALESQTTGPGQNTAIGAGSMFANVTGGLNTALGTYSMLNNNTGSRNTAVGFRVMQNIDDGNNNIMIGYQAGDLITSGSNNIVIGYDLDPTSATASNELNIGNTIFGDLSSNTIVIGDTSVSGTLTLDVEGQVGATEYCDELGANCVTAAALAAATGGNVDELSDADNDTRIQVEEGADDDIIRFDTAGTERMVIDDSGNVGIGTSNPSGKLHIDDGNSTTMFLEHDDTATGFSGYDYKDATANKWATGVYADTYAEAARQNAFEIIQLTDKADTLLSASRLLINNEGLIGVGTVSPDASALLDLTTTNKGLLPPRVSDPATAITSPATGLVAYDTATDTLQTYNGTAWVTLGADNLGDHTTTQDLIMSGNKVVFTNNVSTGPDISFDTGGLLAAESSLQLSIDSDNNQTDANFIIRKDADNNTGTAIFIVNETGIVSFAEVTGAAAPTK